MIEVRFIVLRKSQVDKIYPIVDFCHAGGCSEKVVFCLESGFFFVFQSGRRVKDEAGHVRSWHSACG
jgi:hypothetical protein